MNALAIAAAALLLQIDADPQESEPATPGLHVTLRPAFGGDFDLAWSTFVLEIRNETGAEIDAVLQVGSEISEGLMRRPEKLATGVSKRIFFYLPGRHAARVRYRVTQGRHVLAAGESSEGAGGATRTTSSTGSSTPTYALALMSRLPAQVPPDYQVALCPEESLPDRWIGLQGIDVIFLRDYGLDRLLPSQRRALRDWLRRGGIILACPGSSRDWLTSEAFRELAVVRLGASAEANGHGALEADYGRFRDRSTFVLHRLLNGAPMRSDDPPTASMWSNGDGRVIVVPFDVESAPFDVWAGGAAFRGQLVDAARAEVDRPRPRISAAAQSIHAWSMEDVSQLPNFPILLALAIVYVVVVGPVNFVVLKRMGMGILMIVTVPAISLFFLLAIVGLGWIIRGTATVTREVCLLEAPSGSDAARETHLVSVFSASARSYELAWSGTEIGVPATDTYLDESRRSGGRYYYRYYGNDGDTRLNLQIADKWMLTDVAFSQWQSRAFAGLGVSELGGPVSYRSTGAEVVIENLSGYGILRGLYVDRVAGVTVFEAVPAGEKRTFAIRPRTFGEKLEGFPDLEARVLDRWLAARSGGEYLLCVLDRLPDEATVDADRAPESGRACLLQVFGERP